MKMIWHDDKAVQLNFWANPSRAEPFLLDYLASRGKLDSPAHYLPKEMSPLPRAHRYEVRASPCVVMVLKPCGTATSVHEPILHRLVLPADFLR